MNGAALGLSEGAGGEGEAGHGAEVSAGITLVDAWLLEAGGCSGGCSGGCGDAWS